ncbi:MAG: GNAT family N-acetyltransferase, partial [Chloroflexota bacterium]
EDFPRVEAEWAELLRSASNDTIFLTPWWQKVWWQHFHGDRELLLLTVHHGSQLVGLAPMKREGDEISLLGDSEVCDFMDFIASHGEEKPALGAVMDFLESMEWQKMSLSALRPDSLALNYFVPLAQARGYRVEISPMDVSPHVSLPQSWEDYLLQLRGKDRHELRRKMRRLSQVGTPQCYGVEDGKGLAQDLADFFHLFEQSERDKRAFMTPQMADFFKGMMQALAEKGFLRIFFLEIGGTRVAAVISFDYGNEVYIYNSGYDPSLASLSPGLLLKVFCLQQAILSGRKCFHFLRGREAYKYDLGGQDMPIYRCLISRA